jgi:hypothetical protein
MQFHEKCTLIDVWWPSQKRAKTIIIEQNAKLQDDVSGYC